MTPAARPPLSSEDTSTAALDRMLRDRECLDRHIDENDCVRRMARSRGRLAVVGGRWAFVEVRVERVTDVLDEVHDAGGACGGSPRTRRAPVTSGRVGNDPGPARDGRTRTVPLDHDVLGSGPLLVAVHGITEDRTSWDGVPLADHFRTVRVDLRGHGRSARTAPYDPLTLAADVHELVVALQEETPPLVVGHSYGAVVATGYASRFPVRGVVAVDQPLDVTPLPEQVARAVRGPGFHDFMTTSFSRFYGEVDPAVAADLDARRELRQDVVLGAWAPLLDLAAEELTAWMADLMAVPEGTAYLSLHGLPLPDGYARWLRTRIPGALVEAAPVVTHYPHLADPSWFVRRLIAFDADRRAGVRCPSD